MIMEDSAYVFGETRHAAELDRLRLIESIFDPSSQRLLLETGLGPGKRCLEIGAGAGSIATWMAELVGPKGHVAAVDISSRFLQDLKLPNVVVHQSDIRAIDLEPASYDLAHARFVFIHLDEWRASLDAALRHLKPGGYIVLEEPDFSVSRPLAGTATMCKSFARVHDAIKAMFSERTMDYGFGLRLASAFQEAGLEIVHVDNDVPIVRGGHPMSRMMGLSALQLRERYLSTGMATAEDIDNYGIFSADPSCWAIYHGTVRATARKPRIDAAV